MPELRTPRTEAACAFVPANEPWSCSVHPAGYRTAIDQTECSIVLGEGTLAELVRDIRDYGDWRAQQARAAAPRSAAGDLIDIERLAQARVRDDNPTDPDVWELWGEAGREHMRKWARRIVAEYDRLIAAAPSIVPALTEERLADELRPHMAEGPDDVVGRSCQCGEWWDDDKIGWADHAAAAILAALRQSEQRPSREEPDRAHS